MIKILKLRFDELNRKFLSEYGIPFKNEILQLSVDEIVKNEKAIKYLRDNCNDIDNNIDNNDIKTLMLILYALNSKDIELIISRMVYTVFDKIDNIDSIPETIDVLKIDIPNANKIVTAAIEKEKVEVFLNMLIAITKYKFNCLYYISEKLNDIKNKLYKNR